MATNAMFLEIGLPIPGRETKALEVFASSMQYWAEQKAAKKIEDVRTYGLLTGNQTDRSVVVVVEGSAQQLDAVRHSEPYRDLVTKIVSIGQNFQVNYLEMGDEMTERMKRFGKTLKEIGR